MMLIGLFVFVAYYFQESEDWSTGHVRVASRNLRKPHTRSNYQRGRKVSSHWEKMTMTITETRVEERLQPEPAAYSPQKKATKHSVPYSLMRSASFDRLKQFPTYFCVHSSAEIYRWLFSSKNKVSSAFSDVANQLQQLLLTISVFGSIGFLVAQVAAVMFTLATATLPFGLHFLLTCTLVVATLVAQVFFPSSPHRRSRSTQRKPRD